MIIESVSMAMMINQEGYERKNEVKTRKTPTDNGQRVEDTGLETGNIVDKYA
jgi:hypothetical protein